MLAPATSLRVNFTIHSQLGGPSRRPIVHKRRRLRRRHLRSIDPNDNLADEAKRIDEQID